MLTKPSLSSFPLSSTLLILNIRGGRAHGDGGSHSIAKPLLDLSFSHELFEAAATAINFVGGLVLLVAAVIAIINTAHLTLLSLGDRKGKILIGKGEASLDSIRLSLGSMITYSLELLVAADVIDTLTKPAHEYKIESLYKIGLVVVIRTTLAYFLGKEIEVV